MYIWLAIYTVHSVLKHHYCGCIRMYKCTSGCLNIIIAVILECTNVHLAGYLHSTQCACCTSLLWLYSNVQMYIWLAIYTVHSVLVVHHYCGYIRMYKCTSGWLFTQYTVCLLYIIIVFILECTNVHLAGYLHSTQCACCTSLLW